MTPPARRREPGSVRARITVLVAAAITALAGDAAAQPVNAQPPRWRVEIVGGWAGVTAADLNSRVDYETALLDSLRSQPVQQTHDGALLKLDHAFPIGGRILRRLGGHWSLGAGFSTFSAEQASSAAASYRYTVVDPRAQEYQRQFSSEITVDPLVLQAREYFSYAQVGYDLPLGRHLTIGAALDAGWLFAECELDASEAVVGGFYPTSNTSTIHMSGRGNSFGADALVSARVNLTRRWGLLVEGGQAWHEVKKVTGSLSATTVTQDGEATEPELTQARQADGRWMNRPVQANAGRWRGTVPDIGAQGRPFTLSLSGWQVRFGVSLGL